MIILRSHDQIVEIYNIAIIEIGFKIAHDFIQMNSVSHECKY